VHSFHDTEGKAIGHVAARSRRIARRSRDRRRRLRHRSGDLYLTRRWGWKVALASAVIGTAAALMIFEFPFDLIVMTRTNPPIPTHPMLYRQLYFLPLFLVQFSTVSLLTLLPSMRVTAYASYVVAGMFVVFAVWAAFRFAFPAEPLPLALNGHRRPARGAALLDDTPRRNRIVRFATDSLLEGDGFEPSVPRSW
jgi:hypothetical protein